MARASLHDTLWLNKAGDTAAGHRYFSILERIGLNGGDYYAQYKQHCHWSDSIHNSFTQNRLDLST